ncbi:hypothetical protein A9Q84_21600 [Halobacteriovorax marinus]|uniref:Uncharacterized protein n=1 Tax=Halobacteriovorax marinus TaxID=97084 RepID=A0A1Y5F7L1_9BACT|nr:hypothetical protein A9Q84_21600 [Halobacteriovorax marinus]
MDQINEQQEITTKWIESLALEEINMEESGVVNFNDHLNPLHMLEESSIDFMDQLREKFEIFVSKFNQFRGSNQSGSAIKVFKISNTINDFMLFRNSLRLVVARKAADLITIGFLANGKEVFTARLRSTDSTGSQGVHEVRAHLGPFNNISWRFNGEIVEVEALVRHYLSEFIRNSAR